MVAFLSRIPITRISLGNPRNARARSRPDRHPKEQAAAGVVAPIRYCKSNCRYARERRVAFAPAAVPILLPLRPLCPHLGSACPTEASERGSSLLRECGVQNSSLRGVRKGIGAAAFLHALTPYNAEQKGRPRPLLDTLALHGEWRYLACRILAIERSLLFEVRVDLRACEGAITYLGLPATTPTF